MFNIIIVICIIVAIIGLVFFKISNNRLIHKMNYHADTMHRLQMKKILDEMAKKK